MSKIKIEKSRIFAGIRFLAAFLVLLFIISGCSDNAVTEPEAANVSQATENNRLAEKNTNSEKSLIENTDIPKYSGEPYVVIDNNKPDFKKSEITDASYEKYSKLDNLGRCGVTVASVGKDIMPTQKRGAIGQVKPTGWHTVKYSFVDGRYLYNRCHLLGYQLTGENANEKNLITGTRYLNVEGMLPFEELVADYVKETGNHVMYKVTPIYKGNNLLASGVEMQGYSVEDKGAGVSFHVYCYNIQPGVKINYATGESRLDEKTASKNKVSAEESGTRKNTTYNNDKNKNTDKQSNKSKEYVLNMNTHKFHLPECYSIKQMSNSNKGKYTGSREDLIEQGYEPCKNCNP